MPVISTGFRELMTGISKGNAAPVNILMGEEPYYIDLLVRQFESKLLAEEDKDFNLNVFYGNDSDVETIAATARQFPVMADRKLVILKEAQSMERAKDNLDRLAPYIENPNSDTVMVIAYKGEELKATSKFMKAAAKGNAVVFSSKPIKEGYLPGHLKDYCQTKKIGIDRDAIELLCEYIGNPLSKLFGEVDKLIVALSDKSKRITVADVEQHIGMSKDFNNLELQKALVRKDYTKTMKIVHYFSNNPKSCPTVVTAATLFSFFQRLVIFLSMKGQSETEILNAMGFKSNYALRDYYDAMRNYTFSQAVNAIHSIRRFDAQSKGIDSTQNEYELLKELIFEIFTK